MTPDAWARLGSALREYADLPGFDTRAWNLMCDVADVPSAKVDPGDLSFGAALVRHFGLNREMRALSGNRDNRCEVAEQVESV